MLFEFPPVCRRRRRAMLFHFLHSEGPIDKWRDNNGQITVKNQHHLGGNASCRLPLSHQGWYRSNLSSSSFLIANINVYTCVPIVVLSSGFVPKKGIAAQGWEFGFRFRSFALLLFRSFALSLCSFALVALSLFRSFTLLIFRSFALCSFDLRSCHFFKKSDRRECCL